MGTGYMTRRVKARLRVSRHYRNRVISWMPHEGLRIGEWASFPSASHGGEHPDGAALRSFHSLRTCNSKSS